MIGIANARRLPSLALVGVVLAGAVGVRAPLEDESARDAACVPQDQCCKVCDRGKACGNTCISRAKNCHKGRGCACNVDEVCE